MITKYSVTIAKDTEKFSWDTDHDVDILVDESKAIINFRIAFIYLILNEN